MNITDQIVESLRIAKTQSQCDLGENGQTIYCTPFGLIIDRRWAFSNDVVFQPNSLMQKNYRYPSEVLRHSWEQFLYNRSQGRKGKPYWTVLDDGECSLYAMLACDNATDVILYRGDDPVVLAHTLEEYGYKKVFLKPQKYAQALNAISMPIIGLVRNNWRQRNVYVRQHPDESKVYTFGYPFNGGEVIFSEESKNEFRRAISYYPTPEIHN